MATFHEPIAAGFAFAIGICFLFTTLPALARGGGGGGSHGSHGPGRPPPPVFLEGSTSGRSVASGCSISRRPITDAYGKVSGYRRVQVCNLD